MFFDAVGYDRECSHMFNDMLIAHLCHYDRRLTNSCTSAAVHTAAATVALGATLAFVPIDGYLGRRAHKKRWILKRHVAGRGLHHDTRLRDIAIPMAAGAAFGALTLGAAAGAESVVVDALLDYGLTELVPPEKAVKVGTHLVLDSGVMAHKDAHYAKQKREIEERYQKRS